MNTLKNYYSTLQVNPAATATEIKQAYRRLAKIFHPDSQNQSSDHNQIIQINAAYEILSDPKNANPMIGNWVWVKIPISTP